MATDFPAPARSTVATDDGASPPSWPVLFAQNLYLPQDLGGSRYPTEVCARLVTRGVPVTIVTSRLHGQFPHVPGITYQTYPITRRHPFLTHLSNVVGAASVLRRLPRQPGGVAIAASYDVALALLWARHAPRTPMVFIYHSEFYSEWVQALRGYGPRALGRRAIRAYMQYVERTVFAGSDRIIPVSQFSARQIVARAPAAAPRLRHVPTGVDTSHFNPPASKAAAKRAVGLSPDRPVILGVGRLAPVKQFDRLIQALYLARQSGLAEAHLVIAGEGPERTALEAQASQLGLADHVTLAGFCDRERLCAFMQAADLQVCSSAFENFSLAILEANACGTPVLGTPGGGTPELVGLVDPALVLRDDAPRTIAEGISFTLGQPSRLADWSRIARKIAAERFDWERVVDQLLGVCEEVRHR